MQSNCFDTGCTSSFSSDVIQRADDEDQVRCSERSLIQQVRTSSSSPVDLPRTAEQTASEGELAKLPLNLKLNGILQSDEAPLDLSVGRRDSAPQPHGPSAADRRPEVVSAGSRLRCSKSQNMTSTSLARLLNRFGTAATSTTSSTSVASTVLGGRPGNSASHDTLSAATRSVTAPQSTRLITDPLPMLPGKLATSPERPAATAAFCPTAPAASRWRRDSFWANGGWLHAAGATVASSPSSSLVAEHRDDRKRPRRAATGESLDNRRPRLDAQSVKLNRKLFLDHRKSSHRSSARVRSDRKLSSSGSHTDSWSGALSTPQRTSSETTSKAACIGSATSAPVNDSTTATSPKRSRPVDSHQTSACGEPADTGKKQRRDADGDVAAAALATAATTPGRGNLTSLRCGSCGARFESLYRLTVHLEETGHTPASDVAVLPAPSPAASPSSSDRKLNVASPVGGLATPPTSAPQRLVRGQDVWLAHGVEQTDRILRCIQCNAPARSLAELTLHMVHTRHYINIVGPTASSTANVAAADIHQSAAFDSSSALRDKSAGGTVALESKNGLRISSSRHHHRHINAKTRCAGDVGGDRNMSQQRSIFLQDSASVREHDTVNCINKDTTNKDANALLDGRTTVAAGSRDAVVDGRLRTTQRGAAFSVRNLIADKIDGDSPSCALPASDAAVRLPVTPPSLSPANHGHDGRSTTSSSGPEVTSSSDEHPSAVGSRLPAVAEHDVVFA